MSLPAISGQPAGRWPYDDGAATPYDVWHGERLRPESARRHPAGRRGRPPCDPDRARCGAGGTMKERRPACKSQNLTTDAAIFAMARAAHSSEDDTHRDGCSTP